MRCLLAALALSLACCSRERPPRKIPVPVRPETEAMASDAAQLEAGLAGLAPPAAGLPSVVVIVLDTLRADRVAAYGGDADLMPNLNAFAAESRVYPRMRSTAPWTLPAHASLFTGRHAIDHGADGTPPGSPAVALGLDGRYPTLAERLGAAGWRGVGIAANRAFLDRAWGLHRGFDLWLCEQLAPGWLEDYLQGDRITAMASAAISRFPQGGLFLFLNYMDPHAPWVPREGFTAHPERIDPYLLPAGGAFAGQRHGRWEKIRREVLAGRRVATVRERSAWTQAYDADVRYLDAELGRLFAALAAAGHGPEDYTVILSDHGEFLGEHNLLTHSKGLYEEVLRVPLIVRGPGFAPGVDDAAVQTTDVPDLLLAALGQPLLAPGPDPAPLQVAELYWSRHRELEDEALGDRFNTIQRAFYAGDRKLIRPEAGAPEAYDLAADPGERSSLYGRAPWVPELEAQADAWLAGRERHEGAAPALGGEQREALEALGYVE